MLINIFKYSFVFVVSVLLQVLIFNNILIGRMITPFFYIVFLILLPFNTPRAWLLLLAFVLGLSIDVFTDTMGVHAFACVFVAFIRPGVLSLIASRETLESGLAPRVENMSLQWFAGYAAFIIAVHHLILFYIEAFTFEGFFFTFLRVILSSILTLIIVVLSQFLIFRK
jgi:rod shape-determining protein MreD